MLIEPARVVDHDGQGRRVRRACVCVVRVCTSCVRRACACVYVCEESSSDDRLSCVTPNYIGENSSYLGLNDEATHVALTVSEHVLTKFTVV